MKTEELKKFKIFSELNDRELEVVSSLAKQETYQAGVRIFADRALANKLYLVTSGKVSIKKSIDDYELQVDEIGPYESFGWSSIIDPQSFSAGAWAVTKTEVLYFNGEELLDLFRKNNHIGYRVVKEIARVVSKRLKALESKIGESH